MHKMALLMAFSINKIIVVFFIIKSIKFYFFGNTYFSTKCTLPPQNSNLINHTKIFCKINENDALPYTFYSFCSENIHLIKYSKTYIYRNKFDTVTIGVNNSFVLRADFWNVPPCLPSPLRLVESDFL